MFQPLKIELQTPVTHGADEVRELTFARRMTAGDLRGVNVARVLHDDIFEVASRLTGQPPSVIRSLDIADYMAVAGVVTGFLDGSR
ncbi:MAG: phage tail assembly protein [Desulfovibrio sp.]|jgi:hypothetical protein|nr:phage tail assembly protein [Desulfovibrio sp.]